MHSWVSVDFVHHNSGSVSINVVHHSSHISQNNQKINQIQSKYLVSTFIKMSLILYTAEFYSLTDWLQLKVKRVADWVRCSIIHSKISQNSKTYKMKNMWLWSLIQYIMYQIKHVISSWHLFMQSIFWIQNFVNIDLTDFFILVLEFSFVVNNCFKNVS